MPGKRMALLVSADTYADPKLKRLRSPAVDAEALRRVLKDPEIGGFDVDVSINEPGDVVRQKIETFLKNRGVDDLLLLHFGCHGIKDDEGSLYFASADTKLAALDSTGISASFVNNQMTRSRSRSIVLLLDCCYSGAFAVGAVPRAAGGVDIKERFEKGRGRAVLTASSSMEYAWEGDERERSVDALGASSFTAAIVQGLETGAAKRGKGEWVSLDDLYEYAFDFVQKRNPKQTPGKWVFGIEGALYIARAPARRQALAGRRRDYSALRPQLELAADAEVFSVTIAADNRTLAAGSVGVVLVWRGETDIRTWTAPPEPQRFDEDIHEGCFVYSVAFSADGHKLASGNENGLVNVRDLEGGGSLWHAKRHDEAVYSVAFSPDGESLVTGGYDRKVLMLDAAEGDVQRDLPRPRRVSSVAYSPNPDAKLVAVGSLDNTITLWNLGTGESTTLPEPHQSSVERVAFSPDGTRLASCGLDKGVRVWDVAGARWLWTNNLEHEYLVRGIAFSPDGTTLASASWDKTVRLWNTESGAPKQLPWREGWPRHTDWIWSVAFSPDGRVLASAGSDKRIILWKLPDA